MLGSQLYAQSFRCRMTCAVHFQDDLAAVSKDGVDAKIASGGGRMCVTMDRYEVCSYAPFTSHMENRLNSYRRDVSCGGHIMASHGMTSF